MDIELSGTPSGPAAGTERAERSTPPPSGLARLHPLRLPLLLREVRRPGRISQPLRLVPRRQIQQRLQRVRYRVDPRPHVTQLGEPRRNRGDGEVRRIHRLQLVPGDRAAHPALGIGPHRVDRGDGPIAGVLVVVDEHPGPPLLLPPLAGRVLGQPALHLPRQGQRRTPDLEEVPRWLDADVDVDPARAGGLRPALEAEPLEDILHLRSHPPHRGELHARLRIEVDPQLVGVIDVRAPDRPGVQVETAEVGRVDEVRHVHRAELAGAPPARKRDGDGL